MKNPSSTSHLLYSSAFSSLVSHPYQNTQIETLKLICSNPIVLGPNNWYQSLLGPWWFVNLELFLSGEGWGTSFPGKIPELARGDSDLQRVSVDQNLAVRV